MKRKYKVLCGKWETIIEAERREWLFYPLVEKIKIFKGNRKVTDLPLGAFIGIIEIGNKEEEKGDMFIIPTFALLEDAGFIKSKSIEQENI